MLEGRGWILVAFTCLIGVLCQRSGASYVYTHDEANRLIQIKAADNSVLAGYTYDALGRRIVASIGGETTRYYYDGQNVVEERDAAENRLRYHVNGSQYIDERVCTYTDATGEFTYYLLKENFSVAGTGNADGSVITPAGYSSTGSFAGFGFAVADFDRDNDVDQSDFGHLQICLTGADLGPVYAGCEDADLDNDDDVDQTDVMVWFACFSGPNIPPPADCRTTPTSGSFTLHGRPVDVLPDGHALLFDAILRRQPARAHSLMLEHIYQGRERILVFLENGPTPADEASDWHRISKTTPAPAAPVAASSPRTRRLRAVPSQSSRGGN